MKVGEQLKNGAIVVATKPFAGKEIVLACGWNDVTPYVTWNCWDGVCENGHYHRNLNDAVEEFNSRI